jgi:hypothetical protein
MANENFEGHRTKPVRIVHMSVEPDGPGRRLEDAPVVIVAKLEHGLDLGEELQWWTEQLRNRVKLRAWTGSNSLMTSVSIEAPPDQVETVARRLLSAIDDANAAYLERYPAWRREHDERIAEERLREQRLFAAHQTILDRVMEEYQSDQ